MNPWIGRTLGWTAFICGAISLVYGIQEANSPDGDGNLFSHILTPLSGMVASTLLIFDKLNPAVNRACAVDESDSVPKD